MLVCKNYLDVANDICTLVCVRWEGETRGEEGGDSTLTPTLQKLILELCIRVKMILMLGLITVSAGMKRNGRGRGKREGEGGYFTLFPISPNNYLGLLRWPLMYINDLTTTQMMYLFSSACWLHLLGCLDEQRWNLFSCAWVSFKGSSVYYVEACISCPVSEDIVYSLMCVHLCIQYPQEPKNVSELLNWGTTMRAWQENKGI